jgi:DNA-binding IclR family transcriptional regulator
VVRATVVVMAKRKFPARIRMKPKSNKTLKAESGVAALDRGLSILAAFREGDSSLILHDLAARTGFHKSTILRLLVSLERAGCILQVEDGSYHLGPALLRWGNLYLSSLRLHDHVTPILQRLVQETGESATFYTRQADARICLFRVDTSRSVRDNIRVGDLLPLDRGAGGRVLQTFARIDMVKKKSPPLILSMGELDPDAAGLSGPVFGADGVIRGAISLSGLSTRFRGRALGRMAKILLDAVADLTSRLGGDDSLLRSHAKVGPMTFRAAGKMGRNARSNP